MTETRPVGWLSRTLQRLTADDTAVVSAEQRRKVDAAAGNLACANAEQGVVSARNAYNAAVAARPHTLDQQQAQVDAAQAQVDGATSPATRVAASSTATQPTSWPTNATAHGDTPREATPPT